MSLGEEFSVFGDWFLFHFIENKGIAFGLEPNFQGGKLLLTLFRIVASVFIGYFLFVRLPKKQVTKLMFIAVSLILGGAIGNILDSVFYGKIFSESTYTQVAESFPDGGGYAPLLLGKVVDMFFFPLFYVPIPEFIPLIGGEKYLFFSPVFNIADSSLTIGMVCYIIASYQAKNKHQEPEEVTPEKQES